MTRGWPATLEHDEVRLRPIRGRDAVVWEQVRRRNAAWLGPWDATPPPGGDILQHTYPSMARALRRQARRGTALPFVIEVGGEFAGQVTVNNVVRGSAQFASIGYWVAREYAGRGVTPRAVALTIDHCFGPVGLHRIEISVRPENSNSLRVVEKLGLREVGLARRYLHIDGEWRDHRVFEVTREDAPEGMLARVLAESHQSHE